MCNKISKLRKFQFAFKWTLSLKSFDCDKSVKYRIFLITERSVGKGEFAWYSILGIGIRRFAPVNFNFSTWTAQSNYYRELCAMDLKLYLKSYEKPENISNGKSTHALRIQRLTIQVSCRVTGTVSVSRNIGYSFAWLAFKNRVHASLVAASARQAAGCRFASCSCCRLLDVWYLSEFSTL